MEVEFILYVTNQETSKNFYKAVLDVEPSLHVPGMTEFQLYSNVKLGLMPEVGINRILNGKTPHPAEGSGIPRCEIYLKVAFIDSYIQRALKAGAKMVSKAADRDWGDKVCYLADIDGHIIAFAEQSVKN